MVAARAADLVPDVAIASALGSLVIAPVQIGDPRWRLDAIVRSIPALRRFGVCMDPVRARIRDCVAAAICPVPLRHKLVQLLDESLDRGSPAGLARAVTALWRPDWIGASMHAVSAALALDAPDAARRIAGWHHLATSHGRYMLPRLDDLLRRGHTKPSLEVVANLSRPRSEQAFAPSLPLAIALVDEVAARGERTRVADVDALIAALHGKQRSIAVAHAARLALRFDGAAVATSRARSIRERDVRDGAFAVLVREALEIDDLDTARDLITQVRGHRLSQWLVIELARAHFDRGHHVAALRQLRAVTERSVISARQLLEVEIRLAVRRTRETPIEGRDALRYAWQPAAWIAGGATVDTATRNELVFAALLLRLGMRTSEQVCVDDVARILARLPNRGTLRLEWLRIARRSGIDIDHALTALGCSNSGLRVDAFVAEHVATRAAQLAHTPCNVPSLMARGLAGNTDCAVIDPTTIERALFDEGLALSSAAPARRRVLLGVAQHCLRSALVEPQRWTPDVIASRLRMLVHLGGELARASIEKAVRTLPARAEITDFAIECACKLDAPRAAELVFARLIEMRAAGVDVERLLQRIEHHGGLERGFARAFARARAVLDAQLASVLADRWLLELIRRWRERTAALPSAQVLMFIAERNSITTDPGEMFALLASVDDELREDTHVAVALHIATGRGLLERLLIADPPRVDDRMKIWMMSSWRALLDAAVRGGTALDLPAVLRCARLLGSTTHARALQRGELTALGVVARSEVAVDGERYRLRLLDKRTDLMTYLRFADVSARSCYRSDSSFYVDGSQFDVIAIWHDPLSFCFHVEHEVDSRFKPCGFLFGGFAEIDGHPAVALNSLHVRTKRAEVREGLMRAFERALCVPLGITRIGIASRHGGRGPLPSDYVVRPVRLTRLRALSVGGKPVTYAWDDISYDVNTRTEVTHLLWKS